MYYIRIDGSSADDRYELCNLGLENVMHLVDELR